MIAQPDYGSQESDDRDGADAWSKRMIQRACCGRTGVGGRGNEWVGCTKMKFCYDLLRSTNPCHNSRLGFVVLYRELRVSNLVVNAKLHCDSVKDMSTVAYTRSPDVGPFHLPCRCHRIYCTHDRRFSSFLDTNVRPDPSELPRRLCRSSKMIDTLCSFHFCIIAALLHASNAKDARVRDGDALQISVFTCETID